MKLVIALDLGGTKLSSAIFYSNGISVNKTVDLLNGLSGNDIGELIVKRITQLIASSSLGIQSVGISIPGIFNAQEGTVWAPNIEGWNDYPLESIIQNRLQNDKLPVIIENDRSCCILGESWLGAAQGYKNAVFIAVGTGIGAGIMIDGHILKGSRGIGGSIGWMALQHPYVKEYKRCGCFEFYGSGEGIAERARMLLESDDKYSGMLRNKPATDIDAKDIFEAFYCEDPVALTILYETIEYWGMAVSNIISLCNPAIVIFGGGIFGPAAQFIEKITHAASKWAQPIAMKHVEICVSKLGQDAGLAGAARLALMQST